MKRADYYITLFIKKHMTMQGVLGIIGVLLILSAIVKLIMVLKSKNRYEE